MAILFCVIHICPAASVNINLSSENWKTVDVLVDCNAFPVLTNVYMLSSRLRNCLLWPLNVGAVCCNM